MVGHVVLAKPTDPSHHLLLPYCRTRVMVAVVIEDVIIHPLKVNT